MSFYRTPSPLEFSYIASDLPDTSPMVNQFFVHGEGNIDRQQLQDALIRAAEANPGMHTKLKGFWGWRHWDDAGPRPLLEEIDAPKWDGMSSEGCPRLGQPIDLRKDPLCQVSMIRAAGDLFLLFRTHHAISDGRGTVHYMHDVFRILRGEAPLGSTSKLTEWDIALREERPPRPIVEGGSLPVLKCAQHPGERGCRWQRFYWDGDQNRFTAKLIFALGQLAREHHGEGKVLLRIPSDLRRYMKEDEGFSIANCTGALDLEIAADTSMNQIRSMIVKAMRQKEDLSPFMEQHKHARWLPGSMFRQSAESLNKLHSAGRYRMTGVISYMGDVGEELFRCPGFSPKSLFGAPIALENRPIFVGASTHGKITSIFVGTPKALANKEDLQAFCSLLSERLHAL
ncbi:MAG TPA: hypothetical protein VM553_07555 [Dongiaceae bacterium]|nr:hypothetical protein [Dongiaceae bacterium]